MAHILPGSHSGRPLATIPIAAVSRIPPVSDDDYVVYHAGRDASAQVHGQVSHVIRGETAELYAQPFPYRHAPAAAGSQALKAACRAAVYAFTLTPSLATRYYVELFAGGAAVARSRTVTIYVTRDVRGGTLICHRPLCRATIPLHVVVPPAAMSTEISKRWSAYGAPGPVTAAVKLQLLEPGNVRARKLMEAFRLQISKPRRISATEFDLVIRFAPGFGQEMSFWHFTACTADTETRDGLGLPGRHECGLDVVGPDGYLG